MQGTVKEDDAALGVKLQIHAYRQTGAQSSKPRRWKQIANCRKECEELYRAALTGTGIEEIFGRKVLYFFAAGQVRRSELCA